MLKRCGIAANAAIYPGQSEGFFLNGLVHLLGAWIDLGLAPGGGIVRGGGGGGTQSCEVKNTSKIGFQNATGSSSGPCKVPELRIELAVPKFHAASHEIGLKAWIDLFFFSFKTMFSEALVKTNPYYIVRALSFPPI